MRRSFEAPRLELHASPLSSPAPQLPRTPGGGGGARSRRSHGSTTSIASLVATTPEPDTSINISGTSARLPAPAHMPGSPLKPVRHLPHGPTGHTRGTQPHQAPSPPTPSAQPITISAILGGAAAGLYDFHAVFGNGPSKPSTPHTAPLSSSPTKHHLHHVHPAFQAPHAHQPHHGRKKRGTRPGKFPRASHVDMSAVKSYASFDALRRGGIDTSLSEDHGIELAGLQTSLAGISVGGDDPLLLSSDSDDERSASPPPSVVRRSSMADKLRRASQQLQLGDLSADKDDLRRRKSSGSSASPSVSASPHPRMQRGHLYSSPSAPRLSITSDLLDDMPAEGAAAHHLAALSAAPPFQGVLEGLALPAFGQRRAADEELRTKASLKAARILQLGGRHDQERPSTSPTPLISYPSAPAVSSDSYDHAFGHAAATVLTGMYPASFSSALPSLPALDTDIPCVEDELRPRIFSARPDVAHPRARGAGSAHPSRAKSAALPAPKHRFPSALNASQELATKDDFSHRQVFMHRLKYFAKLEEESKMFETWGYKKRQARKAREHAKTEPARGDPIVLPSLSPLSSFKSAASDSFKSSDGSLGPHQPHFATGGRTPQRMSQHHPHQTHHPQQTHQQQHEHAALPAMQPFELFSFAKRDDPLSPPRRHARDRMSGGGVGASVSAADDCMDMPMLRPAPLPGL